jgi:hypothetical protein
MAESILHAAFGPLRIDDRVRPSEIRARARRRGHTIGVIAR